LGLRRGLGVRCRREEQSEEKQRQWGEFDHATLARDMDRCCRFYAS
jgi:hypothetical protein